MGRSCGLAISLDKLSIMEKYEITRSELENIVNSNDYGKRLQIGVTVMNRSPNEKGGSISYLDKIRKTR